MNKRVALLFIGAVAVLTAAPYQKEGGTAAGADFEQQFLAMMPHHHQQATEMAGPCQTKAASADLKALCTKMAEAQQQEKQKMDAWRQSWYQGKGQMPKAEMEQMNAKHKKHMAELNAATGEKFDQLFLMAMTAHHKDGMPQLKACEGKASHTDLKQLCVKMSKDQQQEIQQMQRMMKAGGAAHKH